MWWDIIYVTKATGGSTRFTFCRRWNSITSNLYPVVIRKNEEVWSLKDQMLVNYTFPIRAFWINDIGELYRPGDFFIFSTTKQIGLGYVVPIKWAYSLVVVQGIQGPPWCFLTGSSTLSFDISSLEMFFVIIILIFGMYYYNWKFIGIISSMVMAQVRSVERRKEL